MLKDLCLGTRHRGKMVRLWHSNPASAAVRENIHGGQLRANHAAVMGMQTRCTRVLKLCMSSNEKGEEV